ncbi:SRPBCC domain-containing protein [Arthrobacter wenxiniae]|uniref:Activator of Hsp90 ATPase homologue 1/2-like C-terminal domain-containing protein n=1 Tax=Arthrobacter wenxiniae TaxID=2713570 RepID=A0A7Y7IJC1_9MICC|nr:SRPBCC domain-containing protein [Arthrobacter wenxiniae]NVM96531.1 hypothetical protein [Arthrobacter wenxiniae]
MTTQHHGSAVVGSMRAENGRGTIRREDVYDTTIADLWSALTEPERPARWTGDVSGDLRAGGTMRARLTSAS